MERRGRNLLPERPSVSATSVHVRWEHHHVRREHHRRRRHRPRPGSLPLHPLRLVLCARVALGEPSRHLAAASALRRVPRLDDAVPAAFDLVLNLALQPRRAHALRRPQVPRLLVVAGEQLGRREGGFGGVEGSLLG